MASISSLGAGSGLDLESLLSQLLAAEAAPIENRLNLREANAQVSISAFGTYRGALSDFQTAFSALSTASDFINRTASSSNEDVFTASASDDAAPGSYAINVLSLAQNQRLASADFASAETVVGSGTLNFTVGGNAFSVDITAGENDTVDGIKDAINAASGNDSVAATLLTVDNGLGDGGTVTKLVLTATNSGAANEIILGVEDDDGQNFNNVGLSQLTYGSGGIPGGVERHAPDGEVFIHSNFAGSPSVSDIQDDPDAADLNFLVARATNVNTSVRTSFTTPSGDLETGAGLQEIRVAARKNLLSGTRTPTVNIEIYEAGNSTPLFISSNQNVTTTSTQVFSFTFDASILADLSGADIEVVVNGNRVGGGAARRASVDIGAVEFNANVTPVATQNQLTEIQAAQDAEITVDGFSAFSSSNTFSSVIEGVTINALAESPDPINDPPFTLSIGTDNSAVVADVNAFVEAYNQLQDTVASLTEFDVEAGTAAGLNGDFTLRTLQSQMRIALSSNFNVVTSTLNNLVNLGITTDDTGKLTVDQNTLNDAVNNQSSEVSEFFAGENGLITKLDTLFDSYLGTGGILQTRLDGLNEEIEEVEDARIALDLRLEAVERRFRNQFAALDTLVASLNAQGDFLLQQLQNTSNIINRSSDSNN